jgi:hypothetical protein
MTIKRTYACPGHNEHPAHTFDYLHHPNAHEDPAPRFCPRCGYDSDGEELVAAIVAPHVSDGRAKALSQSADQTYRHMEEGSAHRAAVAEEMGGENAAGLKITNLKDNLQVGDIAAPDLPANPVSDVMRATPGITGFQGSDAAAAFAASAHQGYAPKAGAKAASAIRNFHQANYGR